MHNISQSIVLSHQASHKLLINPDCRYADTFIDQKADDDGHVFDASDVTAELQAAHKV